VEQLTINISDQQWEKVTADLFRAKFQRPFNYDSLADRVALRRIESLLTESLQKDVRTVLDEYSLQAVGDLDDPVRRNGVDCVLAEGSARAGYLNRNGQLE